MLLANLDLLRNNPAEFAGLLVMFAISMAVAITVHEFSHAYVANWAGDNTAKRLGRLSLNPLVHLDPMGTMMLLFIGFGWGKAVPVTTALIKPPVKRNMAAVSVAGVCANLVTAAAFGLLFRVGVSVYPAVVAELLVYIVWINIMLAIFNLLPIPPLDGSNLLAAALPDRTMRIVWPALKYAPIILFMVLILDNTTGTSIVWHVIQWPVSTLSSLLLGSNPLA
jgi:Zn-dependent protease